MVTGTSSATSYGAASTSPSRRRSRGARWPASPGLRFALSIVVVALAGLVSLGAFALASSTTSESGVLYFTTFEHTALYRVGFTFDGSRPQFGRQHLVAHLPGAAGVIFEPDGDLLVGAQYTGNIEEVDPRTGAVRTEPSGCPSSFLLSLDPAGNTLYTAGLPGPLCSAPVDPLGPGTIHALSGGDTQVTGVAFGPGGEAFYTSSNAVGDGNFGLINLSTFATTRMLSGVPGAHGMAFDPITGSLFVFGGHTIFQVDAARPRTVLSSTAVPDTQLDSGTTDGHGHLFLASNYGQLVVIGYGATGRLGAAGDTVDVVHLHDSLDDVAPLVGPGSRTVPGSRWESLTAAGLGLLLLMGLGGLLWPRLRPASRLPTWDLRRREAERISGRGWTTPGRSPRSGATHR